MSAAVKEKLIIIGNGMVGYKLCEKIVSKGLSDRFDITVFGEEPYVAYDRVHLSSYFDGAKFEDLQMAPRSWYEENSIKLLTSNPIIDIDLASKTVIAQKGDKISYDKLVFATGSGAFVPPVKGVEKEGVFVYRTIEDLDMISSYAAKCKTGTVIGGGLLGLEAAKALMDLNLKASVVEFAPRLMPRQVDEKGSEVLLKKLEKLGLSIYLNKNTSQFTGVGAVDGLEFADGSSFDTDMVVISAGIKPRDELAGKVGITTGPRGGIVVDNSMKTSVDDIYAIGECALHDNMVYGLVAPGYEMAEVLISTLTEGDKSFVGFDMSTKLKLIGVDVASFGDAFGVQEHECIVYENKAKSIYKRINITPDGKNLLGGILIGDAAEYNILTQYVNNRMKLPKDPETLILPQKSGENNAAGNVENLPDAALICSCEGVTKGQICDVIKSGEANDIGSLKACTKAGTGCGGCLPLVKDLMTDTFKKMGVTVKKTLCEHFEYSRQEIYDIIRIKGIKTYKEALDTLGKGHGCEICKPAVASILSSVWNELILKEDTIQDTNDRFLANIQRGGTYSVIPRIAGGEITAEKLIVLGEVAKKYNLYVKITGGQRVDLLGAEVGQLPDIWEELVNAGFESGHAYGKSVRTVKSCVGSTWCRFGVQDSVGFAIEIEDRYKGLRSPHKLKFAVSGCIRECAEAQSKDVGIIATDKGWNMYVAGNGGAKPQHALLFASDIDKETCIKYTDRFLMYYVRTADPLTRTSVWFNKIEGGIEYLRDVIINDSLGICEQLDQDMIHHVNTYQCEWKDAVENPLTRKKFRHFLNVDDKDETIEFVDERGQRVPAPW